MTCAVGALKHLVYYWPSCFSTTVSLFPLWHAFQPKLAIYCNSKSIIKCINKNLWNQVIFLKVTMENDFDAFNDILYATQYSSLHSCLILCTSKGININNLSDGHYLFLLN